MTKTTTSDAAALLRAQLVDMVAKATDEWGESIPLRDKALRIRALVRATGWCDTGASTATELCMLLAGAPVGGHDFTLKAGACVTVPAGERSTTMARVLGGPGNTLTQSNGVRLQVDPMMVSPASREQIESYVALLPDHLVFELASTLTAPAQ